MDFATLENLALDLMGHRKAHLNREVGAIYAHGLRVSHLALRLRERIFPQDSSYDAVLRCAGLFHDIGKGIGEHGHTGAVLARDLLAPHLTEKELDAVCTLIDAHNKRNPLSCAFSPAARLLQDADLLDHFGCYEIWMHVQYATDAGEHFYGQDAIAFYRDQWPAYKAECLAKLNYPLSREIFKEKAAFSELFARRAEKESLGEIFE